MAQITVTINGKTFRMACDDGEEERLMGLARRFDGWISELKGAFGEIGDQRLTVMAGIMATDQLSEAERKLDELTAELTALRHAQETAASSRAASEGEIVRLIDRTASRLEVLSESLSKTLKTQ
ncbi:cell division protein ZapA [Roseibium aquae]|uniref:Cell division protein ZapA n=1 Tax=Roseibium aquae TaxID=1323746 RepID=A0A916WV81_9HYPH|nr:cell division protein ZapA [Roseibium aquae]GGB32735.1 cell division protein ZapA [Roseibium aquae]